MFKNIYGALNAIYKIMNEENYDNIDPNLVKYFRVEYGRNWKEALSHHIYIQNSKNDKK